jgi:ribonuclease Z
MSVRDLIILGCSSQQPTRFRNHGAYVIRWNEEGFLFDPGEGTQRQFILAELAPPTINRIFISHFHGDHCLGLGSFLMRLNLDKVTTPIHCYYPASGKRFFDRLRYGAIYHDRLNVVEHPVFEAGVVHDDGNFKIEANFLDHGVENLGWRITEKSTRKFDPVLLKEHEVKGPLVTELQQKGTLEINGKTVSLDDVSHVRPGEVVSVVIDTRSCPQAIELAKGARLLLCESTYLETEKEMAHKHHHMTAKEAAEIAKAAGAEQLILTHFSARYVYTRDFEKEAQKIFPNSYAAEDLKVFPFPKHK